MKFKCEICGGIFENQNACAAHESDCRARHETLLFLNDELNKLITAATYQNVVLGVEIPSENDTNKTEFYNVRSSDFESGKRRITLHVHPKEQKPAAKKKADKKNESTEKS